MKIKIALSLDEANTYLNLPIVFTRSVRWAGLIIDPIGMKSAGDHPKVITNKWLASFGTCTDSFIFYHKA